MSGQWASHGDIMHIFAFPFDSGMQIFPLRTGGSLNTKIVFYGSLMCKCAKCLNVREKRVTKLNATTDKPLWGQQVYFEQNFIADVLRGRGFLRPSPKIKGVFLGQEHRCIAWTAALWSSM